MRVSSVHEFQRENLTATYGDFVYGPVNKYSVILISTLPIACEPMSRGFPCSLG